MKTFVIGMLLVMTGAAQPSSALQSARAGTLTGRVVQEGTDEPIAGANIVLIPVTSLPERFAAYADGYASDFRTTSQRVPQTISDISGMFSFQDLNSGRYEIRATFPRFVHQTSTSIVDIVVGRSNGDVLIRLAPESIVTGNVVAVDGARLAGMELVLIHLAYDAEGQKNYRIEAKGKTDDRGVYRLFGIASGQYIVCVRTPVAPSLEQAELAFLNPNSRDTIMELPKMYRTTYFPNVQTISDARPIRISAGMEMTSVNFVLEKEPLYQLRGRVLDGTTNLPSTREVTLSLVDRNTIAATSVRYNLLAKRAPDGTLRRTTDGTFEIDNVPAGDYWLVARTFGARPDQPESSATAQRVTRIPVIISNSDVNDVLIILTANIQVEGRLQLESKPALASAVSEFTGIRVVLIPPIVDAVSIGSIPRLNTSGQSGGEFRIENLVADDYQLQVIGLPSNAFVKRVFYEGVDVSSHSMRIAIRSSGTLTIVLSLGAGNVKGTLVNELGSSIANTEVVLVPDKLRGRPDLYKSAITDGEGHFVISGIVPAEYKLFSWMRKEPYFYFEPASLVLFEDQGVPISIGYASTISTTIKVISAVP